MNIKSAAINRETKQAEFIVEVDIEDEKIKAEVLGVCKAAKDSWDSLPIEFKDISEYSDYEIGFIHGSEWKNEVLWTDTCIEKAIRYGIELSQTGKAKEGFPDHIVNQIVKFAVDKLKDNLENS